MSFISNEIEKNTKKLEQMPLKIDKGSKKMIKDFHKKAVLAKNTAIKEYETIYTQYKNCILDVLEEKKEEITPLNRNINYNNLRETIKNYQYLFNKKELYLDYKEILGLNKIMCEFDEVFSNNLKTINCQIDKLIKIFRDADLQLTNNDFNYTLFTQKYMTAYFTNQESNLTIIDTFDQIFWRCPNIVQQLKLSFIEVIEKHHKKLEKYAQAYLSEFENSFNIKVSLKSDFIYNIDTYENVLNNDEYLLVKDFLEGNIVPDDYLPKSDVRLSNFNYFLVDKEYETLTPDSKKYYIDSIFDIKKLLTELKEYNYFKPFIDDIFKRYEKKDTYKNLAKDKLKEISKERSLLKKEFNKSMPKKSFFKKSIKQVPDNDKSIIKQNEICDKLDTLENELIDIRINDNLVKNLNETSTLRSTLIFVLSDYNYFLKCYNLLETEDSQETIYNRLLNLVYSKNYSFIDEIIMTNRDNLIDIISSKYKLLDIKLTKEDLTDNMEMLNDIVNYICRTYRIEKVGLKFENLVLINKIKKVMNEQK